MPNLINMSALLEVHNLKKSFGGVQAVRDCTFQVEARKATALIGPNGAGKTTALNCISGFTVLNSGRIILRGEDISSWPAWRRSRAGLSRTFQMSRLFRNLTVRENLLLAARENDDLFWRSIFQVPDETALEARIKEAAELIGLQKDLHAVVTDLSYGEQKLFDLARAVVNPHTMLLLDEPVAGVNPVIRQHLKTIIRKLVDQGETVLFIEHDIDFVRSVADQVIVMDQGSVLTEGKPDHVLLDKKVLAAYLGTA